MSEWMYDLPLLTSALDRGVLSFMLQPYRNPKQQLIQSEYINKFSFGLLVYTAHIKMYTSDILICKTCIYIQIMTIILFLVDA